MAQIHNTSAKASPLPNSGGLVSDIVTIIIQSVNFAILCQLISVFGTGTNIINIICFVKQGFKDSVNITLLGLAISDLGGLLTLIWMSLCANPLFYQADLPFESMEFQYLTGGWPHVIFARVTSCITAFITFERCLCITLPLKVKTLITPKRVTITIASMFISVIVSVSPVYYASRVVWKFFPERNKTMLGLGYTPDREIVERVSFAINNVLVPFTTFVIVIVCTFILVFKLRQKAKWREKSTSAGQAETQSNRDQRVSRMVVMISALFLICFIPVVINFIIMIVEPEVAMDGKYKNLLIILFSFGFLTESINSSLNIFIYYHMSSKYRSVFRLVLRLKDKEEKY